MTDISEDSKAVTIEVAAWLRKFAVNHRFFATNGDAAMTPRDHAWFAELSDELADRLDRTA